MQFTDKLPHSLADSVQTPSRSDQCADSERRKATPQYREVCLPGALTRASSQNFRPACTYPSPDHEKAAACCSGASPPLEDAHARAARPGRPRVTHEARSRLSSGWKYSHLHRIGGVVRRCVHRADALDERPGRQPDGVGLVEQPHVRACPGGALAEDVNGGGLIHVHDEVHVQPVEEPGAARGE
eukprot:1456147-Prymnesium_polylepis.1